MLLASKYFASLTSFNISMSWKTHSSLGFEILISFLSKAWMPHRIPIVLGSLEGDAEASARRPRIDMPKHSVTVSWIERGRLEGSVSSRFDKQHLGRELELAVLSFYLQS